MTRDTAYSLLTVMALLLTSPGAMAANRLATKGRAPTVSHPATSLQSSTYLGGSDTEVAEAVAIGPDGSIYLTGYTWSSDFPTTPGAFDQTRNGGLYDSFVAKLSADGSTLLYSTLLGGMDNDWSEAIGVNAAGEAYVVGWTRSTDFPTTPGTFDTTWNGGGYGDIFVTKLSPDGSALVYSTFLGGSESDCYISCALALGPNGSAYIAGVTQSRNFPTTPGAFDRTYNGDGFNAGDAFVSKLSADGSTLVFSTYLGGNAYDRGDSVTLGADGSVYVSGLTASDNFPTTPGAFDTTYNGGFNGGDVFITQLNAYGSAVVFSTYLGGSQDDCRAGLYEPRCTVAVGLDGAVYVAGTTQSGDFPVTPGAFDTRLRGNADAFVSKLDATGSLLLYSTYLGGGRTEYNGNLAVDAAGVVYLAGETDSRDFPTTPRGYDRTFNGYNDAYVVKLLPDGNTLEYSTFLGGSTDECAESHCTLALGPDGTVYVTGYTDSPDFPTTPGAFDTTANGRNDVFVTGLRLPGQPMHVASIDPFYEPRDTGNLVGTSVTIAGVDDQPVPRATVILQVTLPSGRIFPTGLSTHLDGSASVSGIITATGTFTFTVLSVSKPGWTYVPAQNVETSDSITVP